MIGVEKKRKEERETEKVCMWVCKRRDSISASKGWECGKVGAVK